MIPITVTELDAYENGEMSYEQTLRLFARLIKTGLAWKLQGHYGRTAVRLIQEGIITVDGHLVEQR